MVLTYCSFNLPKMNHCEKRHLFLVFVMYIHPVFPENSLIEMYTLAAG